MVSPELLLNYPFFAMLSEEQRKAVALITEQKAYPKGTILLKENTSATKLMVLLEGDLDLIYSGGGEGAITNALVGSIAPGEACGVSSLIEPYQYISSVKATVPVTVIEIDGIALRALMQVDSKLGFVMMRNIAAAVLERLKYTQVELAAARA
ncbi:MAG: cyclic nucleotide-binding domain-containing protein [Anaerolineales bacterium]|jgi:CRP-like cAMP-binding protein